METQVTTTQPKAVANLSGWNGVYEGVDKSDLLIPMLLLGQGQSPFVAEGKAKNGDIVKSSPFKVIGDKEKPVSFVPLMLSKSWRHFENDGNRFVFRRQEKYFEKDKDLPWIYQQDGQTWKREKTIHAYVLLTEEIDLSKAVLEKYNKTGELPDPSNALIPCSILFRSTSYGTGRKLAMHFKMAESFQVPPAMTTFKLLSKFEKNDRGQFYVWDVENSGKTTEAQLEAARQWFIALNSNTVDIKVDESDSAEDVEKAPF